MPAAGATDTEIYVQLKCWLLNKIGLTWWTYNHKALKGITVWQVMYALCLKDQYSRTYAPYESHKAQKAMLPSQTKCFWVDGWTPNGSSVGKSA